MTVSAAMSINATATTPPKTAELTLSLTAVERSLSLTAVERWRTERNCDLLMLVLNQV